jgi:hypothetical protein
MHPTCLVVCMYVYIYIYIQFLVQMHCTGSCVMWTGHERTPQSWPCRLVYLTAYLTSVVLFAAYSATFISFLTVQHNSLPFETFEEILQDGTYKLGILQRSVDVSFFEVSVTIHIQS